MARVFESKICSSFKRMAENLDALPMRAKEVYLYLLEELPREDEWLKNFIYNSPLINVDDCKSPIEKIIYIAFEAVSIARSEELPEKIQCIYIVSQYEIETQNHTYFADFGVVLETKDSENCFCNIIVECDGHDFHKKTKQQVERDNSREYEIKMAGYDVLRFSGSQIYKEPMKCANDIFDYMLFKYCGGANGNL